MITELSGGETNIFSNEAPLMGIPLYKKADWKDGHPSTGAHDTQSDTAIIAGAPNNIGYRKNGASATAGETAVKIERQDTGLLELISNGNFSYRLLDINGRLLSQGLLKTGYNRIATNMTAESVYVLQWSGDKTSGSQKLMHD
jgi:hypothetical protein